MKTLSLAIQSVRELVEKTGRGRRDLQKDGRIDTLAELLPEGSCA